MPGWLPQLETALEILRRAPLRAWAFYFTGALPWALGLIFFLSEMLQSPFAQQRLAPLALLLSLLYLWKQTWQALFAAALLEFQAGQPPARPNLYTVFTRQAYWQPWALAALPLAALAVVPLPMALAFFRGLTFNAGQGAPAGWRQVASAATAEFKAHATALAVVALAALFLWTNLLVLLLLLPGLGESFFGLATSWSQMGRLLLNRVTLSIAAVLAWLILDPLLDAFYAQRIFRQVSRTSGADLAATLKRVLAGALLLAVLAPSVRAQATPQQLDRAAEQVLSREEFVWRAPPTLGDEGPLLKWIRESVKWVGQKVDGFFDWLRKAFERDDVGDLGKPACGGSPPGLRALLIGLGVVLLVLVGVLFYRSWRNAPSLAATPPAAQVTSVDIADESLAADALEESGWLSLADELAAQGEFRLAHRALHLAGLRYLGGRGAITLARWKSGYEYQRELTRRWREQAAVPPLFDASLLRFEMVWYGRHAADAASVAQLREAWKEIRAHAG